ncbi:MAG: hypothetical protein M0P47_12480 [Bacteroidales bacterium]|nr:hypothetical protein [Bacteroidales bacterium]
MKIPCTYFWMAVLIFSTMTLSAQTFKMDSIIPQNAIGRSVLFAKDIVLDDQPDYDQENAVVTSMMMGQKIGQITNRDFVTGKHLVTLAVNKYWYSTKFYGDGFRVKGFK